MWKQIPSYPKYEASDRGEVRNAKTLRVLKTWVIKAGYEQVHLGKGSRPLVHRAVAEAFHPNPENLPQVDHINGDRLDNRAANLQWLTVSANCRKAVGKINYDQVAEILERRKAGDRGIDLAMEFGISQQLVCDIYKGRVTSIGCKV